MRFPNFRCFSAFGSPLPFFPLFLPPVFCRWFPPFFPLFPKVSPFPRVVAVPFPFRSPGGCTS